MRTKDEIMNEIRSDSKLNKARAIFSSYCGKIEQKLAQNHIGPIEMRGLEMEACEKIFEILSS